MKQLFRLFFLFFSYGVLAQNISNSPYSRFGVGDLQSNSSAVYSSMGGVGIAINNPRSINIKNPASYAWVFKQQFTLEAGLAHQTNLLSTNTIDQITNATKFNYLKMGFPVTRWWGSSFGLIPFSEKAYSFEDYNEVENVRYTFEGNGGISNFYFGNGFRPHKNISFGVNFNYLFGSIVTSRKAVFDDSSYLNAKAEEETIINGLHYDFGLLLFKDLKRWKINLGFTFDNGSTIDAEQNLFTQTFRVNGTGELLEDTVQYIRLDKGELVLPSSMGYGFSLVNDKWLIAADFQIKNWTEYQLFGQSDNLQNSSILSVGAEYIPDSKAINNYFKMIRYRVGFYNGKSYLNLRQQSIDRSAVTIGVGLPLKRSNTLVNLSTEIGQSGTTDNNLIKQSFVNFKIGFVLSDVWFIKRKYD